MKVIRQLVVGVMALLVAGNVLGSEPAQATYRLDLLHTGGKGIEVFAVDRLRQEPLPWPGHPARVADDGTLGAYRYEVRAADGTLLQARGYATIFGE